MQWSLRPHPARPAASVIALTCAIERDAAALNLVYRVEAGHDALHLPDPAAPLRTDGLWKTTCLELFVADAGGRYREFNFSPSGQWAAYRFTARRAGMAPLAMPAPPAIRLGQADGATILSVQLPGIGAGAVRLGITAVIEERDGTKSYWALQHGADAPDFHDPDCFVAQLPPAD